MGACAGIDWASEKHDVLIEDPAEEELLAETLGHDEDGVSALCAALACFEVEVVAIERADGLLVDRLLDAGLRVLALHPNQVKAARDRFRASGGKSGAFDRFVLCELAFTDAHRFRILEPDCDETKAIKALTRAREDLVVAGGACQPAPGRAGAVLARGDRPVLGSGQPDLPGVPGALPNPIDARGLGEKRLAAFLKAHSYNNPKPAAHPLARLRSAPAGRAGELEIGRRRSMVLRLSRTLEVMVELIHELGQRSPTRSPRTPTARSFAASSAIGSQ